ncbi:MAG: dephospho-CoA kinase [Candidatus Cryptobacteroides sp.]
MSKVLVITGGIGSGKSEVCRILRNLGYTFQYDADSRVKMLYEECPGLLQSIEDKLECSLRDGSGKFMPSLLAERIFSDRKSLEDVESLVFPRLMDDFRNYVRESEESPSFPGLVMIESATILEKRALDGIYDAVLFVDAPFEVRLERACRRDSADRDRILARMKNQTVANGISDIRAGRIPADSILSAIAAGVDAYVDSNCSLEELQIRVRKALEEVITKKLSI